MLKPRRIFAKDFEIDRTVVIELLFLTLCFLFYFTWAMSQQFDSCPDEYMRYLIPKYIYQNGSLPLGQDASIRNDLWGDSYGFGPMFPAIIAALFMKITSFFSTGTFHLLMAARMVSILSSVGTVFIVIRLSRRLFKDDTRFLFIALIAFWPQYAFISTYVNNDALSIFSTALIVYFWVRGLETRWDTKSCVGLSIGISICLMSYYFAYGFILVSILLFFWTNLRWRSSKDDTRLLLKKTALIVTLVFAMAGWQFIRNWVLYGDLFGLRIESYYSEIYATGVLKPSIRVTPQKAGMTLIDMIFTKGWLYQSYTSFIGYFGYMSVPLNEWMYHFHSVILGVGACGCVLTLAYRLIIRIKYRKSRAKAQVTSVLRDPAFNVSILIAALIPPVLSCYYSYSFDYEPQGRYWLTMIIPMMYLAAKGFEHLTKHARRAKSPILDCVSLSIVFIAFSCLFQIIPQYYF